MQITTLVTKAVASTMIMVPMYIPLTPASWDPIFTSISCNPTVQFQLIINPDSGPGASPYPYAEYITRIAKIRTYPNAKMLGYVHTSYGTQSISAIQSNITKYAYWKTYKPSDIHLDGIFFDESPSAWTAQSSAVMTSVTSFARQNFSIVSLNPGTVADIRFFPLADNIIIFENSFSTWTPSYISYLNATYNAAQKAKSVIMMYSYKNKAVDQYLITQAVTGMGMKGVFVSNQNGYTTVSTIWDAFVAVLKMSNSGV